MVVSRECALPSTHKCNLRRIFQGMNRHHYSHQFPLPSPSITLYKFWSTATLPCLINSMHFRTILQHPQKNPLERKLSEVVKMINMSVCNRFVLSCMICLRVKKTSQTNYANLRFEMIYFDHDLTLFLSHEYFFLWNVCFLTDNILWYWGQVFAWKVKI